MDEGKDLFLIDHNLEAAEACATPIPGTLAIEILENGEPSSTPGSYPIENVTGYDVPITAPGNIAIQVNDGETGYISPRTVDQVCVFWIVGWVIKLTQFGRIRYRIPVKRVFSIQRRAPGEATLAQRLNPNGTLS